ncbi:MAG: hypothetical protein GEU81_13215 [Nitriliruptorales bacterium]|nr:hypothetical protein [Nitriliruptorales bacterium]
MDAWQQIVDTASKQFGVVRVSQVVARGIEERTFRRHAQRFAWQRLHRGVYALPGYPESYERDVMAALLANGPRCVASHRTAAALTGLMRRRPRPLQLLVPADRAGPRLAGVQGRRTRTLFTCDVTAGPLRRTAVPRTLCDLAAELEEGPLQDLAAVALQEGLTTIERIVSCSSRLGKHHGRGQLRAVLEQLSGTSSDSGFERRARSWLCDRGLPPHPCLYPVRAEDDVVVELDIAYPDEMVFIDCHGFPWHSSPSSLLTDNIRSNGLAALDWVGLRLDEEQLATPSRAAVFLRQLRRLLDQRAGRAARLPDRSGALPARPPRAW